MNIPRVLMSIRPDATWMLDGDTYNDLEWTDQVQLKPTFSELESEWVILQAQDADADYQSSLKADIETQFDSTLKAFALVVLDEINILRVQTDLKERTLAQLITAIGGKL